MRMMMSPSQLSLGHHSLAPPRPHLTQQVRHQAHGSWETACTSDPIIDCAMIVPTCIIAARRFQGIA